MFGGLGAPILEEIAAYHDKRFLSKPPLGGIQARRTPPSPEEELVGGIQARISLSPDEEFAGNIEVRTPRSPGETAGVPAKGNKGKERAVNGEGTLRFSSHIFDRLTNLKVDRQLGVRNVP